MRYVKSLLALGCLLAIGSAQMAQRDWSGSAATAGGAQRQFESDFNGYFSGYIHNMLTPVYSSSPSRQKVGDEFRTFALFDELKKVIHRWGEDKSAAYKQEGELLIERVGRFIDLMFKFQEAEGKTNLKKLSNEIAKYIATFDEYQQQVFFHVFRTVEENLSAVRAAKRSSAEEPARPVLPAPAGPSSARRSPSPVGREEASDLGALLQAAYSAVENHELGNAREFFEQLQNLSVEQDLLVDLEQQIALAEETARRGAARSAARRRSPSPARRPPSPRAARGAEVETGLEKKAAVLERLIQRHLQEDLQEYVDKVNDFRRDVLEYYSLKAAGIEKEALSELSEKIQELYLGEASGPEYKKVWDAFWKEVSGGAAAAGPAARHDRAPSPERKRHEREKVHAAPAPARNVNAARIAELESMRAGARGAALKEIEMEIKRLKNA